MNLRTFAAAAALTATLTGCIRDPDPFTVDTDDVAVHLILVAGTDSVQAVIERPGDPAVDAVARLISGADTTPLVFSAPRCAGFFGPTPPEPEGCHRARLDEPIQPGRTYELEVILEDGSRVTGSTVVPEALTLTTASVRDTVRCGSPETCYAPWLSTPPYYTPVFAMTVRWEEPVDTERLFGHIRPVRTFLNGEVYQAEEGCDLGFFGHFAFGENTGVLVAADSIRISIPNIACPPPLDPARFDSIHAEARVAVMNAEYRAYLDAVTSGSSARESYLSAGLDGAWGVFGAMTSNVLPLTLIRDPAPAASGAVAAGAAP